MKRKTKIALLILAVLVVLLILVLRYLPAYLEKMYAKRALFKFVEKQADLRREIDLWNCA
jgi:hypothetical protein